MKLPKIKTVNYTVELPKTGRLQYRPFLVKEEGAILTAIEFGKPEDLVSTLKNVVQSCIVSDVDVDELLMIEFIYLIILLRTKSKSGTLELKTKCSSCEAEFNFGINLDEKEFFANKENIKLLLTVSDSLSIEMETLKTKYIEEFQGLESSQNKIEATINLLSKLIVKVIYEKKVYTEFTPEEVKENVLLGLSSTDFEKITNGIGDMIIFKMEHEVQCPTCEFKEVRVYDDPLSFLS